MKVIDLLNKIANGEETPKRFKIGFINYDFVNGNAKLDYELFDSLFELISYPLWHDIHFPFLLSHVLHDESQLEQEIVPSIDEYVFP